MYILLAKTWTDCSLGAACVRSGVACVGPVPSRSCALELQLRFLLSALGGLQQQQLVPAEAESFLMEGFYEHPSSEGSWQTHSPPPDVAKNLNRKASTFDVLGVRAYKEECCSASLFGCASCPGEV